MQCVWELSKLSFITKSPSNLSEKSPFEHIINCEGVNHAIVNGQCITTIEKSTKLKLIYSIIVQEKLTSLTLSLELWDEKLQLASKKIVKFK